MRKRNLARKSGKIVGSTAVTLWRLATFEAYTSRFTVLFDVLRFDVSDFAPQNVAVAPEEKFREFLATRGKRLTQEREIIVREIFSDHEHFDVDEIVARLDKPQDGRRVSRATVYRTIAQLEEAGLIRKVARANDREVYEHDYGYPQHDHFICAKCNSLTEFRNEEISAILERVALELGFRMSGHRLEAHGICATCAKPPARRHHKLDMI
ncbi:MAG: Fur family transcriptional regulator [Fuerstiella sp.]